MTAASKAIIYVPGMKPKPPADVHRARLWQSMLEGVRRIEPGVAVEMEGQREVFHLAPWPHIFYPHHSDPELDRPGLQRLLALPGPEPRDVEEAGHWHKRFARLAYLLGDALPFLIRWVADPALKATLEDSMRYFQNVDGIAVRIRERVGATLEEAAADGARLLVIGHSLGSVVAWDVLWEFSRRRLLDLRVDLFLTLGSPLGLNFTRHRLLSAGEQGPDRFPDNIRRWCNLSAIGDMTALDRGIANDYREMLRLGLVESITDRADLLNYFRGPGDVLNVHKCYAYMANPHTARAIADWWTEDR
jgi:hypothetical protein